MRPMSSATSELAMYSVKRETRRRWTGVAVIDAALWCDDLEDNMHRFGRARVVTVDERAQVVVTSRR